MTNEEIAKEIVESWFVGDMTGYVDAKRRSNLGGLELLITKALDAQTAPLSKEDEAILKYIEKEVSGARLHGHISISFVDIERLVSLARRGSSPQAVVTDEKLHELSCKACDVHFRAATYNSYAAEKYRIGFRDGFRSRENFIELGGSL